MIRLAIPEDLSVISKIARQNREFIGFVHFHKRLDCWTTLHEIAVAKEFHNQGIGKQLLEIPPSPVRLKTTVDNQNAIAFYEKYGFSLTGK